MGDPRAVAFVESFVKDFVAECQQTVAEFNKSRVVPLESEQKSANKISDDAKQLLINWLEQHLDNPYPNDAEKQELGSSTGLTMNQITNWFINARQRLVPKLKAKRNADPSHMFDTDHVNKKRRVEAVDRMEM